MSAYFDSLCCFVSGLGQPFREFQRKPVSAFQIRFGSSLKQKNALRNENAQSSGKPCIDTPPNLPALHPEDEALKANLCPESKEFKHFHKDQTRKPTKFKMLGFSQEERQN